MKKKLRRGSLGSRVIAIVITFSLVVSLMTVLGGDASAATSLSGIESIKTRGTISIVEIVPQAGTGSIGYYVGGREPTANWLTVLASKEGKTARETYAKQLFDNLKAVGLMGTSNQNSANYPMIQSGDYAEYLPWDTIPADKDVISVRLDQTEEMQVNGTFTQDAAGDYIEANTYTFDASGGDFVENALYYQHGQLGGAGAENTYYYSLTFARVELTESNVTNYIGVPLYVPVADPAIPGYTYYEYAGTLKVGGDFTVEDEINEGIGYFVGTIVNDVNARKPSTTWECLQEVTITETAIPEGHPLIGSTLYMDSGEEGYTAVKIETGYVPVSGAVYYKLVDMAHSYYAVKDSQNPYREAVTGETGYFDELVGYRFVGNGSATNGTTYYKFTPSAGGAAQNMVYDTIYVAGGYTNSEWFKRYVLDMDGASEDVMTTMRVTVNSVTLDQLTETVAKNANLVVVSAGFDLANNGSTVAYTRDVSNVVLDVLKSKPRVVDSRISGASNLASLVDGTTIPGVTANNVYNFAVGTGTDARSALATNQFHTPFSVKTPYQVVADEITYENFLRGSTNLLSTDISMATCIRYILNTHRVQNQKTSLNVLDIQPYAKKYTNDNTLSVNTVLSWLPQATQNTLKNSDNTYRINITHMSTAELVCNIEDLSEKYDLIYIGAGEKGKNLSDNYYYANIGATVSIQNQLKGLLSTNDTTARYSGNDLTPQKKAELMEYANAGLPIVISDTLISGGNNTENHTLAAVASGNGNLLSVTYSVTPALPNSGDITNVEYQWYYRTGSNRSWQRVSNATGPTYTVSNDYEYRCEVSGVYNGNTYTAFSNAVKRGANSGSTIYNQHFEAKTSSPYAAWTNSASSYYVGNSITPDDEDGTLRVTYTRRSQVRDERNLTYTWYSYSNGTSRAVQSGNGNATFDVDRYGSFDTYYYCVISIQYKTSRNGSWRTATCTSPAYELVRTSVGSTGGGNATTTAPGTNATIPVPVGGENKLDATKIDRNSLMYDVLNGVWEKENVVVQSSVQRKTSGTNIPELDDNQDTLVKYLNLSRPSITLTSSPTEYGGNLSQLASYNCAGNLTYKFTIQNPTDPTPLQTRYTCNLYIDQNGDGRHSEHERIGDISLSEQGAGRVENGALEAGKAYTMQRILNQTQFSGVVAWKLEIVKVGDTTVHASEKGYAYIQPTTPTAINVLQIRSGGGEGVNLSSNPNDFGYNQSQFIPLYNQLETANMYDITVEPTTVNTLNDSYTRQEDVFARLDQFDMIIIGFADCYGDLDQETAQAIAQFIDTGKAVLFTHDTTSFFNVERSQATVTYKYWGYYFNQIIRDKVGLDRYGVTNANFKSEVASGGTGQINETEAEALRQAGYTVAYNPGSAKQSSSSTHGFTDLNIYRYGGGMSSEAKTKNVSQTNKGQITQYPFLMAQNLTVAETHHQYYQLNMNADDIVVWYCLSGNSGNYNYDANHYNDGTNAYYIYNRGNITYSGAGHSTSLSPDEAKLFVNTMVAAYRAAYSKPTVEFKTANDYPATTQLVPMEYSAGSSSQSLGTDQTIYFKLQDTNLTANKSIAVKLYYEVAAGTTGAVTMASAGLGTSTEIFVKEATLGTVYRAEDGQSVSSTALYSNVLYKTVLPAEVLNYFSTQNASETKIYLKAITTIHNGSSNSSYVGSDDLTLKKLGLLRLE